MKTFKLFFVPTIILVIASCGNSSDKTPQVAKITYEASHITNDRDTINRINEKGKQGLWVYKKADGSSTDTVYKDGIPQNN